MNQAYRVQLDLLRKMSPEDKLEHVRAMTIAVQRLAFVGLRDQYPNASDDELALRSMYAGRQVDDMLAAGPMVTEYVYEKPLVRFIRELAARRISRVYFSTVASAR